MPHAHAYYICSSMPYHFIGLYSRSTRNTNRLLSCSPCLVTPRPIKLLGISPRYSIFELYASHVVEYAPLPRIAPINPRLAIGPFLSKSATENGPMRNLQHGAFGLASLYLIRAACFRLGNARAQQRLGGSHDLGHVATVLYCIPKSPNAFLTWR
jgi:hypothetical protein